MFINVNIRYMILTQQMYNASFLMRNNFELLLMNWQGGLIRKSIENFVSQTPIHTSFKQVDDDFNTLFHMLVGV